MILYLNGTVSLILMGGIFERIASWGSAPSFTIPIRVGGMYTLEVLAVFSSFVPRSSRNHRFSCVASSLSLIKINRL